METARASTPCTRVCTLDRDGVCLGCHRTVDEIVRWRDMGEAERLRLMRDVLPLRAQRREPRMDAFDPFAPDELRRVLHPLSSPPPGKPYNRDELRGILPDDLVPMPAAVLVGIVVRDAVARVLLTLRTDGLRHHAGQVSFPGGRMETGDDGPLGAATREAWEEIGLPATSFEPLGYLDPMLTITGFRVTPVVGRVAPTFEPRPDPNEVAEVFEVPLVELVAPSNMQSCEIHVGGRPRHVYEYVGPGAGGRRIWGATALILHNLAQRLDHTRLEQA